MSKNATLAGTNLFSTSILTLDARTGRPVWHFQTIHTTTTPSFTPLLLSTVTGRPVNLEIGGQVG